MGEGETPRREGQTEGSPLPAEMMARYQGEMRRRAAQRDLGSREVIGRVLLVAAAVVGLAWAWRFVVYAVELGTYARLATWGKETEGIVLRMRTVPPVPVEDPARRIVTYGFWAGQQGVIQQEDVGRDTFLALYMDGPVQVVYAPRDPETSRIVRELAFPPPWVVVVLLVLFGGLGYGGVWAVGWAEVRGAVRGTWERWRRKGPSPNPPPGEGRELQP